MKTQPLVELPPTVGQVNPFSGGGVRETPLYLAHGHFTKTQWGA